MLDPVGLDVARGTGLKSRLTERAVINIQVFAFLGDNITDIAAACSDNQPILLEDKAMTLNVGTLDRILRLVLGLFLILVPFVGGVAFFSSGTATLVSVIVGLVLVTTAALRFCPLYRLLGIQTCKV
jgi:hypothetical protein